MGKERKASGFIIAALCIGFLPGILFAQAGKSGMAFLKLGVSGRGVSMADADGWKRGWRRGNVL